MRIRFFGGNICTMSDDNPSMLKGELWTENDRISYIGPEQQGNIPFDREIDLKGNLLMPGFKNAHTHSGMTFLRSAADDLPLLKWLHEKVFPLEDKLCAQAVYEFNRLAILEYLSNGITSNFDMYHFPLSHVKASLEMGFRTVLCGGLNDFSLSPEECEELYLTVKKMDPLVSYRFGIHAEYTCAPDLLKRVAALCEKYAAPIYCHNSETREEVEDCISRTGMSPTQWMRSFGLFEYGGGCFHCVHLSEQDMEIFEQQKLWAVTNPASNAKLASGIAPLTMLAERGIGLAIGTDGPATNNRLDFFREMYLCSVLQKLTQNDPSAMSANQVVRMATTGGALAIGMQDGDCLSPGKYADMIVIDLAQPNMQPQNNILTHILYAAGTNNVKMTMVGGRILYEDGNYFVGTDPAEIYAKAAAWSEKIQG